MTERLEELKKAGKQEIKTAGSGGANPPWVNWGDEPNWVEVKPQTFFESKYGLCAEMLVTTCHDEKALEARGTGEDGNDYTITVAPGLTVNMGLYSATLEGKISTADLGKSFYIGFEGWGESRAKNRFRLFSVVPLSEEQSNVEKVAEALDAKVINDDLPF